MTLDLHRDSGMMHMQRAGDTCMVKALSLFPIPRTHHPGGSPSTALPRDGESAEGFPFRAMIFRLKEYGTITLYAPNAVRPWGNFTRASQSDNESPEHIADRLRYNSVLKEETGCWEWARYPTKFGYGRMTINNKSRVAHRLAYELAVGEIPPGKVVMHICDNPPCWNPAHLRLGTHRDNVQDCIQKGRSNPTGPKDREKIRGSNNRNSVLNENQVLEIRKLLSSGIGPNALGRRYGVSKTTIRGIRDGVYWAWLKTVDDLP
jgi:hypothetical protein